MDIHCANSTREIQKIDGAKFCLCPYVQIFLGIASARNIYVAFFVVLNRTIFPHCKKYMREDEIVHKRYILSEGLYVFGPLLASKSRERYKKGLHSENMEKLTIANLGKITSELSFFFRNDADGTTYILDPPTMTLEPGESQVVID